jgi:ATPase family AAA domain-containing protein 3A/B
MGIMATAATGITLTTVGGGLYVWAYPEIVGQKIGQVAGSILAGMAKEAPKTVADGISEGIRTFGKEVGEALREAGKNVAQNAYDLNYNFNAAMASSMFYGWAPYVIGYGAIATGVPLGCKYVYEVYKHRIGKPKMQIETKQRSWLSPVTERVSSLWAWGTGYKPIRPIFQPELRAQIDDITASAKNIARNKGVFEWALLYGPPGTGKTMVAREIAEESGMDFYLLSAAELAISIQRGEHIPELNKFLNQVERTGRPSVIFFDEFDAIGRDRKELDQTHLEIQTTLLARTGTGNKKIMLVAATNRKEALDKAIVSRFTHKLRIGLPNQAEREKILGQYINQLFSSPEIDQFFNPNQIEHIAKALDGFSGRSISQMLNAIRNKKATTADGQLTLAIMNQKISQFIMQEREEAAGA